MPAWVRRHMSERRTMHGPEPLSSISASHDDSTIASLARYDELN